MQPQHEATVRGVLSGAPKDLGIKDVKVTGTSLREFVKEVLKDEFASLRKNRLTWRQDQLEPVFDPKLQVGLLRKDGLAYIGPFGIGKWYIQNGKLLRSNGTVASMEDLSRERPRETRKDGVAVEYRSDHELAVEMLGNYVRCALALDPNLCPYCAEVSPKSRKEYMQHVYQSHPKEFLADAENNEDSRMDLQADAHGESRSPMPSVPPLGSSSSTRRKNPDSLLG